VTRNSESPGSNVPFFAYTDFVLLEALLLPYIISLVTFSF